MNKNLLAILILVMSSSLTMAQREKYPLQRGDGDLISGLSWSPGSDLILTASGDENALRLWDVGTGRVLWKTDVGFLQDDLEPYSIRHADWSSDQKLIVTGTDNGKLQLWDATVGKLIWNTKAHADTVTAIAISPDGRTIVSSADLGDWKSELKVWHLSDGKLLRDLSARQRDISAIRFTDGNHFKTGNGFGQITTWSLNGFSVVSSKQLSPCGTATTNRLSIVYSPDFSLLAAQCNKSLMIRNVSTGRLVRTIQRDENSRRVDFSEDNRILVLPNSEIFDLRSGKKSEFRAFDDGVLNQNGSLIASFPSYRADGVQIFDTLTGKRRGWLVGHPGVIKSLAFSTDGKRFASGSADRIVRVWDTQTKAILFSLEGHSDDVESVEFSENDKTLTSRSEKETITWEVDRGTKLKEIREGQHFEDNRQRAVSRSGRLALVEEYEKPFRLVNAATNETIREFVFIDQLDNLVFCPDGKHFLAKPWWTGWQLWNVEGNSPIREFDLGYSVYNRVAFEPDGKRFITGGEGQNIFMFDLESGKTIWSLFPIDQDEFEAKKAREARRVAFVNRNKENARLADIENAPYADKVYITFDHYGDMTPLGEQRIAESDTPNKSKIKKSAADATAIWLRLHNDSPLPVSVPTQSMYLPNRKCFHQFPDGQKLFGLCDNREISVWLGLEDKDGESIPYGFDFGSSVILLPGKSALFAVNREILRNGNTIRFSFTFQNSIEGKKTENYGTEKVLKFRESDLPKF
jgi:WD40 repeat protein